MRRTRALSGCVVSIALAACGCGSSVQYFKVSSFPEGAVVYVDGEPRGQTNFERLGITFEPEDRLVTIRLEKDGYQGTGAVLSRESPAEQAFFLQEAPRNEEILQVLKSILGVLDRVAAELKQDVEVTRR